TNPELERSYWLEKLKLFNLSEFGYLIEGDCMDEIRKKIKKEKNINKILECPYWTKLERLTIKSWLNGGLKKERM
ncbi:MAG: hypothetical protein ACTSX6_08245, partial [Candidatus Heimdallarchaeaceae archaeon]